MRHSNRTVLHRRPKSAKKNGSLGNPHCLPQRMDGEWRNKISKTVDFSLSENYATTQNYIIFCAIFPFLVHPM